MNKGFSLIEALVVMAIIGILTSIAMPSYSSYLTRAKKAEMLVIADRVKAGIVEYYIDNAEFPSSDEVSDLMHFASKSKYVESLDIEGEDGFTITGKSNEFNGEYQLRFVPEVEHGIISWNQVF